MPHLTGGQAIVAALEAVGVDTVFGIPGVHNASLYDALVDARGLRHVLTRHEQGAAFMADGFARASGRIACLSTITGPGITNAATALGEARADASPILHIATSLAPQQSRRLTGELHELGSQSGLLRSLVSHHRAVHSVREIPDAICEAVHRMYTSRPGPASVEIPLSLLDEVADVPPVNVPLPPVLRPSPDVIRHAAQLLSNASAPLILVGSGAMDAADEILNMAERLQSPVLTMRTGKGVFPDDHRLALGCRGYDDEVAFDFVRTRDVALVVGCSLGALVTDYGRLPLPARVVQVDIDSTAFGSSYPVSIGVHGDATAALTDLLEELPNCSPMPDPDLEDSIAAVRAANRSPGYSPSAKILQAVRCALPPAGIFANDMTRVSYDALRLFETGSPRSFLYPSYFGTLGFSLPSAIGAQIACPDRPVVSISGDGGFLFTSTELATAVREQLSIAAVVFNDGMLGAIDGYLRDKFSGRAMDVSLRNPDFVSLGLAYGAHAVSVREPQALADAITAAHEGPKIPTLIEYVL